MNKERLEEMKTRIKSGFGCLRHFLRDTLDPNDKCVVEDIKLLESDIGYLINQAERAQDYKTAYEIVDMLARSTVDKANELKQQNKRYREALEFYADKENYKPFDGIFLSSYQNKVDEDGGEIARKALKGE